MTEIVMSARQATTIAVDFMKDYYYFARPLSAKRGKGQWDVRVDVGLTEVKVAKVAVDSLTGEIIEYELPGKPEKGI